MMNADELRKKAEELLEGGKGCNAAMLLRADVNHDSEILLADINTVIDLILTKQ